MQDMIFMRRALELAVQAEGYTTPNPMVGCVITDRDGNIVGEGYHRKAGEPHAEINALQAAGKAALGGTAYVTLEPCAHFGKTGPCCAALVRAGIKRAVIACNDPNPLVCGKGVEYLRQHGVEVVVGICREEAELLNERFFVWIRERRPFVTLKYAMTVDGKIASSGGDSKWITGEEARTFAHRLRRQHDGIIVGIGTVLKDDPELTTRMVRGKNPVRIILDCRLRIPLTAAAINPAARTLIIAAEDAPREREEFLNALPNVKVLKLPSTDGKIHLDKLMEELIAEEITSILVEGGGEILGAFYDAGLGDRLYAFVAPVLVGGAAAPSPIAGAGRDFISEGKRLRKIKLVQIGEDFMLTGLLKEKD